MNPSLRNHIYFASLSLFLPVAFVVVTVGASLVGSRWEGQWFPVTVETEIVRIEETDGGSFVWVQFNKISPCAFGGLAWYRGSPDDRFNRVVVRFNRQQTDDSQSTRPTGIQDAGPWFIGLTPAEIRNNSFAQAKHDCHPLWQTSTLFYPGDQQQ